MLTSTLKFQRHQHHFESKYATTCFQFWGRKKKKTLKSVEFKYESASEKRYNETHGAN